MNKPNILGVAHGSNDDSRVDIDIDTNNWNRMDDLQRTTTMYHELSHDILNAKHVQNDKHLMHPTYMFDSTTSLVVAVTKLFKQYKNNNLKIMEKIDTSIDWDRSIRPLNQIIN